jgi:hypothetical protein
MAESHQRRTNRQRAEDKRAERLAEIERQLASGELIVRKASPAERDEWARERQHREQRARTVSALVPVEPGADR